MIGSALERTRRQLGGRRVTLSLPSDLPLLYVDGGLIVQVFVNLFENISKHTPDSTSVEVKAVARDKALQVVVRDNGPGLAPGSEQRVFEKSYRGSSRTEGFGLGLTICQGALAAHGGKISARNAEQGGAEFELIIPVPEQQPEVPHGG